MHRSYLLGLAGLATVGLLLLPGCSGKQQENGAGQSAQTGAAPPPPLSPDFAKVSPNSAGGAANPHGGAMSGMANPHGNMMGGVPNPHAGEKGGQENPEVVKAVGAAAKAEAKLKASPNDSALRKQTSLADATAGDLMMNKSTQPPHEKYGGALRYYRRALELDPANASAAQNKDIIEGIYKQMGRPIPQ